MNKTAIKNFAIWARTKMMEDVRTRLLFLGITEKEVLEPLSSSTKDIQYFDTGAQEPVAISGTQVFDRMKLAERLEKESNETSYERAWRNLVENTAYVWFNRLVAIRFMEVNEYLSDGIRMLSSTEQGKTDPDIVSTPFDSDLEFTDKEHDEIVQLKLNNDTDQLFRLLLFKRCHQLHDVLPGLFEGEDDAMEFLMRLSVVDADGVIAHLVKDIPEEDWRDQVQIIGWIYQFYNSELKDETFALLKKNVKVTKERIPAATQLFTPDWIVRYMVENSLGRLWIERMRGVEEENLPPGGKVSAKLTDEGKLANDFGWKYYLPEAEQTPEVDAELSKVRAEYSKLNPEDLTFIDPCMGSGHILVYAFDVLMQIYLLCGYEERDAAQSILKNNLYGLDIDERAYQLSYFALMMKAMAYDKRILSRGIRPHVYAIEESNDIDRSLLAQFGNNMDKVERKEAGDQMAYVLDAMHDAKEYGSAIQVETQDWELLRRFVEDVETKGQMKFGMEHLEATQEKLRLLLEIAEVLAGKYWTACTNPPYMSSGNMDVKLSLFSKEQYPDEKSDLFSIFIERCKLFCQEYGFFAMITQHSWMFLVSHEKIREKILHTQIMNMLHLGARAFDEIGGEVVQTTAFSNRIIKSNGYFGQYIRLVDFEGEAKKKEEAINAINMKDYSLKYKCDQNSFNSIPGSPISYWMSALGTIFTRGAILGDIADARAGLSTGNNDKYMRLWFEPSFKNIIFDANNNQDYLDSGLKFVPCNKGGSFRKWYGNNEYVIDWTRPETMHRPRTTYMDLYYKPAITWSVVGAGIFNCRRYGKGFLFDHAAASLFVKECEEYIFALLNSVVVQEIMSVINPTLNTGADVVLKLPVLSSNNENDQISKRIVTDCVNLSSIDWDSFETSWDFACHPLLTYADDVEIDHPTTEYDANGQQRWTYESERASLISEAYENWKEEAGDRFTTLKANEEELNRIFIDIYGLQDELTPEVADKDITVHRIYDTKADVPESMSGSAYVRLKADEIKSIISYAIGCMFGRYSLDEDGLIYAGGDWNGKRYKVFKPDEDNVLPVTDEAYFDDDLISRFVEFASKVYGESTLEENLTFIAKALDERSVDSRATIRDYILNDFFKDHTKTYQKRPIYWLFDSGKQNGFKAFVYMHRWNEDTIARVRSLYLHKVQEKYENRIRAIDTMVATMTDNRMIAREEKRKEKLKKQIAEVKEYDEILDHLANEHINIDLDDGVKVNYEKVQTDRNGKKFKMLAPIK